MKAILCAALLLGLAACHAAAQTRVVDRRAALNSGFEMPVLGLGTWTLNDDEAEQAVFCAIQHGCRLIDTARYYGNEKGVGRGVRRAIAAGLVKRGDVFVTSKIMPSSYGDPDAAIQASLDALGLDYIDLMLIHQPGSNDRAVYAALERGAKSGRLRSIGISNYYTRRQLDEVLSYAHIVPAVIQNENHIFYQNAELQNYAAKFGIVIESWYPFGGRGHTDESFAHPVIRAIAARHAATPAQVILRWHVQAGYVAVPGSGNPAHIAENLSLDGFELSADEMKQIAALNARRRYENW